MDTTTAPPGPPDEVRFRALYAGCSPGLLRFVSRRVHPTHAEDVVAEVFLVAWRRLADVPRDDDAARAWVYGVARQVMLNDRRGERRRQALAVRLADDATRTDDRGALDPEVVARRLDLVAAWPRLTAGDQEVLALTYWDDLPSSGAAAVLGISPVAFRLRLTRARRALRRHLDLVERTAIRSSALPEGSRP